MSDPKAPSRLWRFAPVAGAVVALVAVGYLYGTHATELLVQLPPGAGAVRALEVRVTREDGREVLRARRDKASATGRTVVFATRLPRGRFHLDAWPDPPGPGPYAASFAFDGEDALEVELAPR